MAASRSGSSNQTLLPVGPGSVPHRDASASSNRSPRPLVASASTSTGSGSRVLSSINANRSVAGLTDTRTSKSVRACSTALDASSLASSTAVSSRSAGTSAARARRRKRRTRAGLDGSAVKVWLACSMSARVVSAGTGPTLSRLRLEDHLDAALVLGLEGPVHLRCLFERDGVGHEVVHRQRVVVVEQGQDLVAPRPYVGLSHAD